MDLKKTAVVIMLILGACFVILYYFTKFLSVGIVGYGLLLLAFSLLILLAFKRHK